MVWLSQIIFSLTPVQVWNIIPFFQIHSNRKNIALLHINIISFSLTML